MFESGFEGLELKFFQDQLKQIMSSNSNIKIAFISACFSEKIGKIFFDSGVPVVIAVNSKQPIYDEFCKVFS